MDFKTRRISKKVRKNRKKSPKNHSKIIATLGSIAIVFFLVFSIYKAVASINFNWALSLFSQSLPTDSFGHTNVLLLGTGGATHEGPDLTDTIIVASVNQETGNMSMLSIPRDLYINDTLYEKGRINQIYSVIKAETEDSEEALIGTSRAVENLIGMPIHYYAKVNFKALVDLVDILGGVEIYVEESINDPLYPKDGTLGFEPFYIEKGLHSLDGKTALKYARSRQTTSDFNRSKRQQKLLFAIKEKAVKQGILSSLGQVNEILETLSKNIETNVSSKEIFHVGGIANKFTKDKFTTHVIHDDPSRCGGFLYTPDQNLYGGAFVLVPAGGAINLNKYMQLVFTNPNILQQDIGLQILNGTKQGLLAAKAKVLLTRHCFGVYRYGNARNQQIKTTSYFIKNITEAEFKGSELEKYISFLQTMIPGKVSFNPPAEYLKHPYESQAKVIIELGADYLLNPLEEPFENLPDLKPVTDNDEEKEGEEADATAEENQSTIPETLSEDLPTKTNS